MGSGFRIYSVGLGLMLWFGSGFGIALRLGLWVIRFYALVGLGI